MIDSTAGPRTSTPPSSDRGTLPRATTRVMAVADLTDAQRCAMYLLFAEWFTADRDTFENDLAEKESVVLLTDEETGAIAGFSTLLHFEIGTGPDRATVFFSGDTLVERRYWGTPALPRAWSQYVFRCAAELDHACYWFLISSGFRTYRYLPLFFRHFSPAIDNSRPEDRVLLDRIASERYGARYDPSTGVVRLEHRTPLRQADVEESRRAAVDPHVRFFLEANPRHAEGDELACLVRIEEENLTAAGRRMLRQL